MNTKIFLALIVGFAFSMNSCNRNNNESEYPPYAYNHVYTPDMDDILVITMDDFISYNSTTGEVFFTDLIIETLSDFRGITIKYNDGFSLVIRKYYFSKVSSDPGYGITLFLDLDDMPYSLKFSMPYHLITGGEKGDKTKSEWDKLLKSLTNADKLIADPIL